MFNVQSRKINPESLEAQLNQLICIYRNESDFIQIIRISQPNIAFFEKAVLPNQCIQFSASVDALLEVSEGGMPSSIHADTIPCYQLAISDININPNRPISKDLYRDFQYKFAVAA